MFEVSLESMDTGICLSRSPELFVNSEYSSGDRYRRDCENTLVHTGCDRSGMSRIKANSCADMPWGEGSC